MDSPTDEEYSWTGGSSTSSIDDDRSQPVLDPRSYQIEMFEHSMRQNIIATMATGSGKTMVARLRIEAELQRTRHKHIWFTTPNVVLAQQQHAFLSSQLPSYSFRLITGSDNVQFWSSQDVWDAALSGRNGVVSTPEVLRAALAHAFVSLNNISLLVFDEAHHCMANHPTNLIMQGWYHPSLRSDSSRALPAILGLTASPIMQKQIEAMEELERNLNAVCRSPTLNLEEYQHFVHMPQMERLDFSENPSLQSTLLSTLAMVVGAYDIVVDPTYLRLKQDESLAGVQKFDKMVTKQETPVLKELKRLQNQSIHLQECLGSWATDRYIAACITRFNAMVLSRGLYTIGDEENVHLHGILSPVTASMSAQANRTQIQGSVSQKVATLAAFLAEEFTEDTTCVIFVERRATAWALRESLASLADLHRCKSFTLVGESNAARQGLADLVDRKTQQSTLEIFRKGLLNLCIATSVLEEGIDVQACNLVVCFDDSKNVKSFIQRRGRARRADSRYIIMQDSTASLSKYAEYVTLEDQMKRAYAEQDRKIVELQANEDVDERCDLRYAVNSTGAVLSISQARAHLEHFCNTLPRREGRSVPSPVFLIEGVPGVEVSCRVILPISLPVHLQTITSSSSWRTERMAKKDAAFQAYVALHQHGLLTENLLPPTVEKPDLASTIEGRDSMYLVNPVLDPWQASRSTINEAVLYAYRIVVTGEETLPSLLLLLPLALGECHDVDLHIPRTATTDPLTASVSPVCADFDIDKSLAQEATKVLFTAVLKRKLPGIDSGDYVLPYYLIPDIPLGDLPSWIQQSQMSCPVADFKLDFGSLQNSSFVIRKKGESIPYFYTPGASSTAAMKSTTSNQLQVVRLSRQLNFLQPAASPSPDQRLIEAADCVVSGLQPSYVSMVALIPSILHSVEISLRAHAAYSSGPLKDLTFDDSSLLATAFTAPGAGQHDYQRLEYIGDGLLKYLTSVNVFCLNPHMPESQLSVARDRIINNGRLQRATRDLRLEAFLTTKRFSAHEWTLAESGEAQVPRVLSSKMLADVIEALIGAAYADGSTKANGLSKALDSLNLFLPEIPWVAPAAAVHGLKHSTAPNDSDQVCKVEAMIGYEFSSKGLLLEALTHSTIHVGMQSYERLEFLGDAVVDIIVKEKLWKSPLEMTEGQMTERQSSLVNKDIFAYLTTKLSTRLETNEINVEFRTKKSEISPRTREVCLHDYMSRLPNRDLTGQRAAFLERYDRVRETLRESLKTKKEFPWSDLYHLASPKWCSDVLESIIGAVYVDSGASLGTCEAVLRKVGLVELVERAAEERDVVYAQPLRRLREMVPVLKVENRKIREDDCLRFDCRLLIEKEEVGRYEGASCQAEAESRAAEIVLGRMERGEVVLKERQNVKKSEAKELEKDEHEDAEAEGTGDGDANDDDEHQQFEQPPPRRADKDADVLPSRRKRKRGAISQDDAKMKVQ